LCRCQGRIAAGAEELLASCASGVTVADQLCRPGGAGALHDRSPAASGSLRVGCIRESPLLESATAAPLEFFPAREYGAGGRAAAPRIAALVALARMPEPPPVDLVSYASAGRLAILGPGAAALEWARRLHGKADGQLQVTVFAEDEAPLNAASPEVGHFRCPSSALALC
jgi:hypothetical protein